MIELYYGMGKLELRGTEVYVTDSKILKEDMRSDLYHYNIRHTDDDFTPCTVEPRVVVNFFGTLVSRISLESKYEQYVETYKGIDLTEAESDAILCALGSSNIDYITI